MDVLKVLVGELKMDLTFNCSNFVSGALKSLVELHTVL